MTLKNRIIHWLGGYTKEEYDRIELLIKYEVPYDILKSVYYDIDEKELKILYRRLTRGR